LQIWAEADRLAAIASRRNIGQRALPCGKGSDPVGIIASRIDPEICDLHHSLPNAAGFIAVTHAWRSLLESTDGNRVGGFPMSPRRPLETASRRGLPLRVAILGGGMGGLSCAHELARELSCEHAGPAEITVYDAAAKLGGKARSHYVPATGTDGRGDL